jgi:putative SOS response-associated peptidase YedK
MCGRYVIAYDPETLVSGFSVTRIQPFERRFNVAPQSMVPVVYETRTGERVCGSMRWGLVPHWAKDPSVGAKLANARLEGLAEKPSFRQALLKRRCLLPASGFYEWQVIGADGKRSVKQPWFISPAADAPCFAMAGLFEAWRPPGSAPDAPWLLTCCVITAPATGRMGQLHDRMPLMVPRAQWDAWLARDRREPETVEPLLDAVPEPALQAWPVDRAVGRASAEGPQLIEPLPDATPSATADEER